MYYITLDLEWNQAYAQKAMAVQRQLSLRLRGEVIQIGAVKMDKNMRICGSYQVIVKPKFFKKLHRHVSTLTGITQEQMDSGMMLPEAERSFREWCGDDFVFLTWGPDDIPMLKENFNAHRLDSSWLERTYDLQKIFNMQTDGDMKRQRSLEYAMEYFELQQTLPAHDALNDAYFTALVAKKLNVPEGVKKYDEEKGDYLEESVIGDADAGDDGYVTITEMLEDDVVKNPECPICHKPLKLMEQALHTKGQRYTFYFTCPTDGDILETLKLHRNFNDTWRAKRTMAYATEEDIEGFKRGLERATIRRKSRPRKGRRPRRAEKPEVK
ncbi:MAG: exonuclease domain-containing protein [Clostridia bacterium]|nr:exonuclease domain-containing protein [Clostridia bacterium]